MANRADIAVRVGNRLKTLLDSAGMTAADTTGNLKEPIDDALEVLGATDLQIADTTYVVMDVVGARALATRNALLLVLDRLSGSFDIGTQGGSNYKLNQLVTNAQAMLAVVDREVQALFGTSAPVAGGASLVTLYTGSNYRGDS